MLVLRVVYYALVTLCIGISLYLTYFGFLRTFGELTLPFTIVIGLVLFAADFLIQRYREIGRSIGVPMILFVIGAFFSTISNFNFLYTNFMTNDVTAATLREQYDVFRDDLNNTQATLFALNAVQRERDKRNQIETELENMRQQATDPSRPGCGIRCQEHIRNINGQLTTPPTDLAVPASLSDFGAFYSRYRELVYAALDSESSARTYVSVSILTRDIAALLGKYESPQDAIDQQGLSVLPEMANASEDIERRANAILGSGNAVSHTRIDPSAGRLGEIVYSLKNGLVERPNMGATMLSLIAAMIVDVLPIVFALIAFRRNVPLNSGPQTRRPEGLL